MPQEWGVTMIVLLHYLFEFLLQLLLLQGIMVSLYHLFKFLLQYVSLQGLVPLYHFFKCGYFVPHLDVFANLHPSIFGC